MKMKYNNVLEQIGNTPLVKVNNLDTGLCELWLKLEYHNPGGSIKDRIALSMIEQAEKKGLLKSGDTIIEATAGNTGLGLALVAVFKGYKLVLVLPDRMSPDKIIHLKAMGAEVILTRSDVGKSHPDHFQNVAKQIADTRPNYFHINQFANPDNPLAHETTTAPEIYTQTESKVEAIVCGIGSSGTLTGLTNYFKNKKPTVELVVGDPLGSVYEEYVSKGVINKTGAWQIEGIGGDHIPAIANFDMVKKVYSITDEESYQTLRNLLLQEGVFAGSSTGTILAAALRYCKEQTKSKTVVALVCDGGNKYLNKVFNQ